MRRRVIEHEGALGCRSPGKLPGATSRKGDHCGVVFHPTQTVEVTMRGLTQPKGALRVDTLAHTGGADAGSS